MNIEFKDGVVYVDNESFQVESGSVEQSCITQRPRGFGYDQLLGMLAAGLFDPMSPERTAKPAYGPCVGCGNKARHHFCFKCQEKTRGNV